MLGLIKQFLKKIEHEKKNYFFIQMNKSLPAFDVVGFIGLGEMGRCIARNFVEAGFNLRVYNRTKEVSTKWHDSLTASQKEKVVIVDSIEDCIPSESSVVVSIVSNDQALNLVASSILTKLGSLGTHLCLSTVSPEICASMKESHASRGCTFVSCPVFGRPPVVVAKKLISVAGGDLDHIERIRPLIASTSQKLVIAGPNPEASAILKLSGNFFILSLVEGMAEAFTLA